MFSHILLPTDGSDRSRRAIQRGLELARSLGARVTGVYVGERTYTDMDYDPKPLAEAALAELSKQAHESGVACECECLLDEKPQDGIVRIALERRCDLIVMGTHGRSRVGKFFLGSTAASVLADCEIPVLLYR